MYEWLLEIEFAILDYIHAIHNSFLDTLMVFVSFMGNGGLIWIAYALFLLAKKNSRRAGISILLALLLNLIVTNLTLKPLIHRTRPFDIASAAELLIEPPRDYSFPSGHTSSSFAASTAVFVHKKKVGAFMYVLSAFIAFSRLYLYVHYPTDVLCGVFIGVAAGMTSAWIVRRIYGRSIPE